MWIAVGCCLLPQDCELVYVAFDILHDGKTGVNHLPLKERQRLLEEMIVPLDEGGRACLPPQVVVGGRHGLV